LVEATEVAKIHQNFGVSRRRHHPNTSRQSLQGI